MMPIADHIACSTIG